MKRVVVIGGGVAGMSAAVTLAECGFGVTIVERQMRLGGHTAEWYRLAPDFESAAETVQNLVDIVRRLGVEVVLGAEVVEWSPHSVTLHSGEVLAAEGVLVCTGFDLFDARRKEEYGYGIYRGVISTADLERALRQGGVGALPVERPRRIAFLQCVGSRDLAIGSLHCSRMCCITSVKQAIELRALLPDAEIYDFYMDMRCFGAGYEELYFSAQTDYRIEFIRGRISEAAEMLDGRIAIKAEDTLLSRPLRLNVDLLVLAVGMNPTFPSVRRDLPQGVLYAGAASSPKSVEESINDAVAKAHQLFANNQPQQ